MTEANIIKYIGLKRLDELDRAKLVKVMNSEYEKIHRAPNNITNLVVNVKIYDDSGNKDRRKKYSIHVRVESPTKQFASEDFDWDIAKAAHKSVNNILSEVQHAFKK